MTREEQEYQDEYDYLFKKYSGLQDKNKSLEQQNTSLQAHIKELENEKKKCGECSYILICPWSRGVDDEKCGKFEPIQGEKQ